MGCGCCGCRGNACSECSGTPDQGLYLSTSGITVDPSGTCYNAAPIGFPETLTYTTYANGSGCITQDPFHPCSYAGGPELFSPLAQISGIPSDTSCAHTSTLVNIRTGVVMTLASGVYTMIIYGANQTVGSLSPNVLFFMGTLSVPSPPCRITTAITFSNAIVPGTVYSVTLPGSVAQNMYAFASGGMVSVVFQKSCCP